MTFSLLTSTDEHAASAPRNAGLAGEAVAATFHPDAAVAGAINLRSASLIAVAACAVVGLLESTNAYIIHSLESTPRSLLFSIREQLPWWMLWMVFMPVVLWLARSYRFDGAHWRRSAAIHSLAGLAVSLAHAMLYGALFHYAANASVVLPTVGAQIRYFLLRYLFMDVMTYCAAAGIYYSFEYFSSFRHSALQAAESEARATKLQLSLAQARIHALRMELNPHFLFNALNAVAGLVRRREHDAAVDILARLGELLRTTLNRDTPSEVPLADELHLLRRFLDIELVRFGDRLRVAWEIEQESYAALVPPLILQPLVENALRHGISRRPGLAMLRISARRAGAQLELVVRDTGDGLATLGGRPVREGIGLSNTRARLEELYGPDSTTLELTDVAGGGARTRLLLPYHVTRGRADVALGA
jgi:hypothetical protein